MTSNKHKPARLTAFYSVKSQQSPFHGPVWLSRHGPVWLSSLCTRCATIQVDINKQQFCFYHNSPSSEGLISHTLSHSGMWNITCADSRTQRSYDQAWGFTDSLSHTTQCATESLVQLLSLACLFQAPHCLLLYMDKKKLHALKLAWQRLSGLELGNGECCSLGKTSSALLCSPMAVIMHRYRSCSTLPSFS